jgi:hypothetical protein
MKTGAPIQACKCVTVSHSFFNVVSVLNCETNAEAKVCHEVQDQGHEAL